MEEIIEVIEVDEVIEQMEKLGWKTLGMAECLVFFRVNKKNKYKYISFEVKKRK